MSLPTNGPYNSKLVSFLNRQYIRLKDNSLKSWRGFKLAVTWSAQIVLYPIYLLVQTGRLVERQFSQRIKFRQLPSWGNTSKASHKPREQPAIEATLTTVESWLPVKVKAIAIPLKPKKLMQINVTGIMLKAKIISVTINILVIALLNITKEIIQLPIFIISPKSCQDNNSNMGIKLFVNNKLTTVSLNKYIKALPKIAKGNITLYP